MREEQEVRDHGLDTLLELDGQVFVQDRECYAKFEVRLVDPSPSRPHGIRYSLTLHDKYGKRLLGFDNAHGHKPTRKGFRAQIVEHDHMHNPGKPKIKPYAFTTPEQLITDFWFEVERYFGE